MEYPTPTLNALVDGCVMDMRAKFAMELLKSPALVRYIREMHIHEGTFPWGLADSVRTALSIADELYKQAAAREWIRPLPETSDIPAAEVAHIERQAAGNVRGQLHAQKVAASERPLFAAGMPGGLNG